MIFSIFFGFSYDESAFSSVPTNFYYYGFNPFYYWKFGIFYLGIILGGYFPSIVLNVFGINNVLVEEFGIKLPIVAAVFISGILVYKILKNLTDNEYLPKIGSLLFVFSPLVFFYSVFHGNPLIISLMFLLGSLYYLEQKKLTRSYFLLAISGSIYLFPFFIFPYFLLYTYKKYSLKNLVISNTVFFITSIIGVFSTYIVYALYGINGSAGTITGSGYVSIATYAFKPATWSLYEIYFIFQHNFQPYDFFQIIFLAFLLAPLVFILLARKHTFTFKDLIFCNLLVAFGFAFLSPTAVPQYLEALVPFVVLLLAYRFNHRHIIFFTLLGLFNILLIALVNTYNFNQYYIDVNPAMGRFYIPTNITIFLTTTFTYLCFAILFLIYTFRIYSKKPTSISFRTIKKKTTKIFIMTLAGIVIFGLSSMVAVAPGLTHLPSEFVFQRNGPTQISPSYTDRRGNTTSYYFQATEWSLISRFAKEDNNVFLKLQGYPKSLHLGVFGHNFTRVGINNTHWVAETFRLNVSSLVTISFLSDASSPNKIGIGIYKNNISENDFLETQTIGSYTPTNLGGYDQGNITIYKASIQVNKTLEPGYYIFMIYSISNHTTDLFENVDAVNNYTSYETVSLPSHNVLVYNQSQNYDRLVLSVVIDYLPSGSQSVLINGGIVKMSEISGKSSFIVYKIPPSTVKDNFNVTVVNALSNAYTFNFIFNLPYPTNSTLILDNYYYFIAGALMFISLILVVSIAIRNLVPLSL